MRFGENVRGVSAALGVLVSLAACSSRTEFVPQPSDAGEDAVDAGGVTPWAWVAKSDKAALLSVHGTSARDVWMSGADDGTGPVVLHFDGRGWQRIATGTRGDLWWVYAVEDGPVFFGGSDATLLRYEDGVFARVPTPGLGKHTIYGVWAAAKDDLYAVGSRAGSNGFIWHYDGDEVVEVPLPTGIPTDDNRDEPGLFKVWGASKNDVWAVGGRGVILRGNAHDGFGVERTGADETLFAVASRNDQVAVVGGTSQGLLLETGALEPSNDELGERTPTDAPLLQGVSIGPDGTVWAAGVGGAIYRGAGGKYTPVDPGLDFAAAESIHSVWVDPDGGVWAVGGDVLTPELDQGLALHVGAEVPVITVEPPPEQEAVCPPDEVDPEPDASIARRWNEQVLAAIRREVPQPTVHARNLFHLSVALWDAYAAYEPSAKGYLFEEKLEVGDALAARQEASSHAAYRVLSHRYATTSGGGRVSKACFDALMDRLGYDPTDTTTTGNSPAALGNRVGGLVIATFAEDGANEANAYADPEAYDPETPRLVVDRPGTSATDPLKWQKLILAKAETQNGIPVGAGAQPYIGAHWGHVTPFALERPAPGAAYLDIGTPFTELNDELVEQVVDVLSRSAMMDVEDETTIDISPSAMGNNPLGTNAGAGYANNPVTGETYPSAVVRRSDFGRVLAEFWADGPNSETPPGHWNTIANTVADTPEFERRLFGEGAALDRLSWDVRVYFALNGALHDAAIAAWELKRKYVSSRPITLVRYLAGLGQRSEPESAFYHPKGLPLVPGLIELITEDSSAPGERHAHLARYVGELAVRAWQGEPGDRKHEVGGVAFVRALEWIPYQRRTFVTPAFPGYVSGHSTFSRAAAQVLTGLTGSSYFPGGSAGVDCLPGYLFFEQGPTAPVRLQWATYFDAADQAGQSRIWGGIHIAQDDFDGRRIGDRVGTVALAKAVTYFAAE